ncbi:hypothetical protein [Caudoviricetes sp.]|nr:hypothetical protein [Caudoviricetes sp.]
MGRRYSIDGQDTNTAATTILELRSTTAIRPAIYDLISGSDATPADAAVEVNLQRTTTAGTSTAVTPQALDSGDPSATATAGEAHSAEPTYTASAVLLNFMQNQRATFRWVSAPEGEIKLPAAANGVGCLSVTVSSAFNQGLTIHYLE